MQAPHPRRPCFTAQKASAPIDQVWRTAVRVECAAPEGLRLGSSQWGLEKFYERLQHPHLIAHASQLGMPIAHVRAPIRAYRLLRFLSFNAACSGGICPRVGVVAGCAAATTWANIGLLHAIDQVVASLPRQPDCQVKIHIDDFDIAARAPTSQHVVEGLARAAHLVVQCV